MKTSRDSLTALRRLLLALARDCGLVRPGGGWLAWLGDGHFLAVLLAALPVLAGLGATVGAFMWAPAGWRAAASFLLVQPTIEELVFRGVLQGRLLPWTVGRTLGPMTLANLLTTICFVALHLLSQPPAWALAVAVPSLAFGHVRDRFGSSLPAIALHIAYNAGFALTAWWVHR